MTLDMLSSLEIILQNDRCLKFFEKFLKGNEPGLCILEFYQKCECKLFDDENLFGSLNDYIVSGMLPSFLEIENIENKQQLLDAKATAFKSLKQMFYQNFLESYEFKELRNLIVEDEDLTNNIRRTSLYRNFYLASGTRDPQSIDRTSKKFGRLL